MNHAASVCQDAPLVYYYLKPRLNRCETLGNFIDEGNQFLPIDEKVEPMEKEILVWAEKVSKPCKKVPF